MNVDRLILATGAVTVPDAAAVDIARASRAEAENFLCAGGHLSLAEWAALNEESKKAFVEAGVAYENDRARVYAREMLRAQMNPGSVFPSAPPAPETPAP